MRGSKGVNTCEHFYIYFTFFKVPVHRICIMQGRWSFNSVALDSCPNSVLRFALLCCYKLIKIIIINELQASEYKVTTPWILMFIKFVFELIHFV